jgi:allantoate deiminase
VTAEDVISRCTEPAGSTAFSTWMRQAGMQVRVDPAGNVRGVYEGFGPRRLLIGSHLGSRQPLGVALGVALVEMLGGRQLSFDIEIAGFDAAGEPLGEEFFGYLAIHTAELDSSLGVVHTILGQTRTSVTFRGTTAIKPLAGAAEWVLAVEQEASQQAAEGLIAAVEEFRAESGAAHASLYIRHASDSARRRAIKRLATGARHIARVRGLTLAWEEHPEQPALMMNRRLTRVLEGAVKSAGFPVHRTSAAAHEAILPAGQVPTAMLVLRSVPQNGVQREDVEAALQTGRRFLEQVSPL